MAQTVVGVEKDSKIECKVGQVLRRNGPTADSEKPDTVPTEDSSFEFYDTPMCPDFGHCLVVFSSPGGRQGHPSWGPRGFDIIV